MTYSVEATVIALVPEYRQAQLRADDGRLYAITERAEGVSFDSLREGQRVRCTVTRHLPRVLRAELVES